MTKFIISIEDRFMKHVQKSNNLDDCWIWTGANNGTGYGEFVIKNKKYYAHRISYELFVGEILNDLFVCHSCDNRRCVNPKHLWLGTAQDNANDREKKKRHLHAATSRGENSPNHKLTEQEIYQIRELFGHGYSQRKIAKMFGVSQTTIFDIKRSKIWKWLK